MLQLLRRDAFDEPNFGPPAFIFIALLLFSCCCIASFVYLRRCRIAAAKATILPTHNKGHHRTLTITTHPSSSNARGDSIFVYDEKMNLIANSSSPPNSPVPEIHVTFPDEEGQKGEKKAGRVVVLRISDTGSVGMEPLHPEPLPPYQGDNAERFQSLDLERMGGLREKSPLSNQRWS